MFQKAKGLTLIELTVAIVIISVTFVGAIKAISVMVSQSAAPIYREQALGIAETMIERIAVNPKLFMNKSHCVEEQCKKYLYSEKGLRSSAGEAIKGLENFNIDVNFFPDQNVAGENLLRVDVVVAYRSGKEALGLSAYLK